MSSSSTKRRRVSSSGSSAAAGSRKRGDWTVVRGSEDGVFFFVKSAGDREIVIGNLDASHTEQDLREAFLPFGQIDRVEVDYSGRFSCAACVCFVSASSVAALLSPKSSSLSLGACGRVSTVRGVALWASEAQQRPGPEALQHAAAEFMREFDERQRAAKLEQAEEVVDEDGFTLVTKARGKRGASDGETHVKAAKSRAKRAKTQTQDAFYGLQKIRARQQAVQQLRQKFLAEKERLKKQKQERKHL